MLDVTFICTGNRCRSPFAEVALRRFAGSLPCRVTSCGTLDLAAAPSTSEMISVARAHGLDLESHRSRHLTETDLQNADLILGFELEHVAAAVVNGGAPAARVLLFKEVVRILEALPPSPEGDPESRARARIARGRGAALVRPYPPVRRGHLRSLRALRPRLRRDGRVDPGPLPAAHPGPVRSRGAPTPDLTVKSCMVTLSPKPGIAGRARRRRRRR